MGVHVFPILNPLPPSLPIPSLWVIPVHQPQASCILHQTWTDDSFLIWYYTCFNAILPNHPPPRSPTESKDYSIHLCLFCCLAYRPWKTGNRTAIWPSNPTAGHIHWGNQNWKRHVYPNVHRSTVITARTWKQPRCPSADEWIRKLWYI